MLISQIILSPKVSATFSCNKKIQKQQQGSQQQAYHRRPRLSKYYTIWHNRALHCAAYQEVKSKPMLCKSHCTTSLHLSFGPWNGLADRNSPNTICLGKWLSVIFPTCPSHLNLHSANNIPAPSVIPNLRANYSVVIRSLHCTWARHTKNTPDTAIEKILNKSQMPRPR